MTVAALSCTLVVPLAADYLLGYLHIPPIIATFSLMLENARVELFSILYSSIDRHSEKYASATPVPRRCHAGFCPRLLCLCCIYAGFSLSLTPAFTTPVRILIEE